MQTPTPEMPPVRSRVIRVPIVAGDEGCGQCRWIYDNSAGMAMDTHKCRVFNKELLGIDGKSSPFYRWACARLPECKDAEKDEANGCDHV